MFFPLSILHLFRVQFLPPPCPVLPYHYKGCNDAYWKNRKGDKWIKDGQKYFENACNKVFNTSDFLFENENIHRKFDDTGSITVFGKIKNVQRVPEM